MTLDAARARRALACCIDIVLLGAFSLVVTWVEYRFGWRFPLPFGCVFWGGFLLSIAVFRRTPGLALLRLVLNPIGQDRPWVLRCIVRISTLYLILVLLPDVVTGLLDYLPVARPPESVFSAVGPAIALALSVCTYVWPFPLQDTLSGCTVARARRRHSRHQVLLPSNPTVSAFRVWYAVSLIAFAFLTVTTSHFAGAGFFPDVGQWLSGFRQLNRSPYIESELAGLTAGGVMMHNIAGLATLQPLFGPGPSTALSIPVRRDTLDDTAERMRVVGTTLLCLQRLAEIREITSHAAEMRVYHEWTYGWATIAAVYQYVGSWEHGLEADGGWDDSARKAIKDAERRQERHFDLSALRRKQFQDVKPQVLPAFGVTWPRVEGGDTGYSIAMSWFK